MASSIPKAIYRHPHRLRAARPRSPFHERLRAQKDLWRGFSGSLVGALRLCPAALALRLPFSVRPAPLLAGSFSPRPTDKEGKSPLDTASPPLICLGSLGRFPESFNGRIAFLARLLGRQTQLSTPVNVVVQTFFSHYLIPRYFLTSSRSCICCCVYSSSGFSH